MDGATVSGVRADAPKKSADLAVPPSRPEGKIRHQQEIHVGLR